jgi:hypothetical protein
MGMSITTARHHKPLSCIVHHLGLAISDISFGTRLVAYINVLAVLHGKCLYNLIAFGSEDLAVDHEVGTILVFISR